MIKTKVKKTKNKKCDKYPKLMISKSGSIVRMIKYGQGALIVRGTGGNASTSDLFVNNSDWSMSKFEDFEGEITLSNK